MQKERIKVYARIKPQKNKILQNQINEVILEQNDEVMVDFTRVYKLNLRSSLRKYEGKQKIFKLDKVFGTQAQNKQIFESTCKNLIEFSLKGINSTIFLYGQTGSGKTFTMIGEKMIQFSQGSVKSQSPVPNRQTQSEIYYLAKPQKQIQTIKIGQNGILSHSLREFFGQIEKNTKIGEQFFLRCSYIEIYNEKIYDLLQDKITEDQKLMLYYDESQSEFKIKNATELNIFSYEQAHKILEKGENNRKYAKTNLNHNSSRSHVIFRIFIKYINKNNDVYESICNFVDLAGSERISNFKQMTENELSSRIHESKSINKSLFFLTQVIDMKSKQLKSCHIPYRNSTLTKILKNSIGGNAKTVIILCLDSCFDNLEQSLSTLKFGKLAQNIENEIVPIQVQKSDINNLEQIYQDKVQYIQEDQKNTKLQNEIIIEKYTQLQQEFNVLKKSYQNLLLLKEQKCENSDNNQIIQRECQSISNKFAGELFYYLENFTNKKQYIIFHDRQTMQQILSDEILQSKNQILKKYKTELMLQKGLTLIADQKNTKLQSQIFQQNKLIDFLLNIDLSLYNNFDQQIKQGILQNALKSIENQKIELLNKQCENKLYYNTTDQTNCLKEQMLNQIKNSGAKQKCQYDLINSGKENQKI